MQIPFQNTSNHQVIKNHYQESQIPRDSSEREMQPRYWLFHFYGHLPWALYRECGQCTLSVARTPQVPLSPLHLILLLRGWPCSKPSPYAENSKSPPVLIYNPRGSLLLSTTLWTQVPQTWHPKPSSSYSLPSQPSLGIRPELVPKQWPYLSKWQKHPTHKNMTSFQSSDPLKAKPSPVPRPTWQAVSAHNPLAFATSSQVPYLCCCASFLI